MPDPWVACGTPTPPPPPVAPIITDPITGQFIAVGVPFTVTVTVPLGTPSLQVRIGGQAFAAATIIGTVGTISLTALAADVGVARDIQAVTAEGTDTVFVDVEDNASFWLDASNPNCSTNAGGVLTSCKSLVSGTALSTVVGAPSATTNPQTGKPAWYWNALSCISGNDATFLAAVTGTNKPFTAFFVVRGDLASASLVPFAAVAAATAGNGYVFGQTAGNWFFEALGSPAGPAHLSQVPPCYAGLCIVCFHSADGLSIKSSVDDEAEVTAAITTVGAIAPTTASVGAQRSLALTLPFSGYIEELIYFAVDKAPANIAAIKAYLKAKWRKPPMSVAVGDSITTAEHVGVTNGGFPTLLMQRIASLGMIIDSNGPLQVGQAIPGRHSAQSGNTCGQMSTRVTDNILGLGIGGASKGYYQKAKLVLLFAGTNPTGGTAAATAAAYTTLLNDIQTRLDQVGTAWRICVTTITPIGADPVFPPAYNALLPAIWDAFDIAHPTNKLFRWDAFQALPTPGVPWYVDSTHPSNTGYVQLVDDPTFGLLQAKNAAATETMLQWIEAIQPP